MPAPSPEWYERLLAGVAVEVGANVQAGQIVRVTADLGSLGLVRAVVEAAYRRGAASVETELRDPYLRRSHALHAQGNVRMSWPTGQEAGLRELAAGRGARIMIHGPGVHSLLAGIDPDTVSRAQPPGSRAWREVEYEVNNTLVPGPTPEWACRLFPDAAPEDALAALWREIGSACRLDGGDPVAAWRQRFTGLERVAAWLTALSIDAVHLQGPGTDLRIGLPPAARWEAPTHVNEHGVEHVWNLPCEEVYTTPDRLRADGHVALTRPAVLDGEFLEAGTLRFTRGQLVEVDGSPEVDPLRRFIARDPGNRRLGELALVDRDSAVARTARPFGMILLDENTASHVALGFGFSDLVAARDHDAVNRSDDHLDLTIGSEHVDATGITIDGSEISLLQGGRWQIG